MYTMEINELYNTAKQYADMIRQEKPDFVSESESAVCVIVDQNNQLITGITSVTVKGGLINLIPAETVAVRQLIDNMNGPAKQIVTVSFKDGAVLETSKASLSILALSGAADGECRVLTSVDADVALKELVDVPEQAAPVAEAAVEEAAPAVEEISTEPESMEDLMSGFDVPTEETPAESLGEPAEYADGFSVDESNPFFEEAAPDTEVKTVDSDVKSMFDQPDDATKMGAAGFQGVPVQGMPMQGGMMPGYPQQGMQAGYPQQGMRAAFPQQGMQSGYPQQGMMAGYPQQGIQAGYPQQGMQAGYPQQGMQAGYPMQGMQAGYPMQGAQPYAQQGGASVHIPSAAEPSLINQAVLESIKAEEEAKSAHMEEAAPIPEPPTPSSELDEEEAPMTKEEMLQAAKQRKKNAKLNANFKKKMRDQGF
ncbi:MAG: hypothetical protein J6I46_04295 [Ruminococcus sp.]|nr:hypothetical protein [Ruminococcus sp.]